jgi:hypothetical protein
MLIRREDLENIKAGRISLAFRRWRRPAVWAGGKFRTAVGELAIDAVDIVTEPELTNADARHAGFSSRGELIGELRKYPAGTLYRVCLRLAGPDPRVALRQNVKVTGDAFKQIENVLRRLDSNNNNGPWTIQVLQNIAAHPGRSATELAAAIRAEKDWLKLHIRKLKSLGLTDSLSVGYRLSRRGKAVLGRIEGEHTRAARHK